jgi:anti-anti-sigma factor
MPETFALSLGGLHVRWERPGGTEAKLLLEGELDNLSVPDLIALGFVDSSGLGALVGAWRHCQEVGGSARAIHPSIMVQRLMDVTGISRFLLGS